MDVINLSLSGDGGCNGPIASAIDAALELGAVIVAAARRRVREGEVLL